MNASEFVDTLEFPVVFIAGNGCPGGMSVAILGDVTYLPFELSEIEGEVTDGTLEVTNLTDGPGLRDWKFPDARGNTIYKIQVFNDEKIWNEQNDEYNAE